jgi:hypothetical protein
MNKEDKMSSRTKTTIEGPKALIAKLYEGGMNSIIPEPYCSNDHMSFEQYEWRLEHWGVKWDLSRKELINENTLTCVVPNSTIEAFALSCSDIYVYSHNPEAGFKEEIEVIDSVIIINNYWEED